MNKGGGGFVVWYGWVGGFLVSVVWNSGGGVVFGVVYEVYEGGGLF